MTNEARKETGVPWLGEIPAHWQLLQTRRVCELTTGGRDTQDADPNGEYPFFVRSQTVERIGTYSFDGEGVLTSGDGAGVGKIFHHHVGKLEFHQRVYLYYSFRHVIGRFFFYYLRETLHRVVLAGNAKSTVDSLRRPMLQEFPVVVPPLDEQRAIVAFLDRKTASIDALIAKKERLINLLQEKRQALITQTVSKGLDPNVPMKESGVDAIGKIPAHWEMRRLGHLAIVVRGAAPRPAGDPKYFGGDYCPWITVGELTRDSGMYVEGTEEFLTPEGVAESRRIPAGTLLLTNSGASLGAPKITKISGCINDGSIAFLSMSPLLGREYAWLYLSSLTNGFREMTYQGWGQQNLNTGIVKATRIPLPPRVEQDRIIAHVEGAVRQIGEIQTAILLQLDQLREYRQALITAAVTGKIDVSKEAA